MNQTKILYLQTPQSTSRIGATALRIPSGADNMKRIIRKVEHDGVLVAQMQPIISLAQAIDDEDNTDYTSISSDSSDK